MAAQATCSAIKSGVAANLQLSGCSAEVFLLSIDATECRCNRTQPSCSQQELLRNQSNSAEPKLGGAKCYVRAALPGLSRSAGGRRSLRRQEAVDVVAPPLHEITGTTLLDNGRFRCRLSGLQGQNYLSA